MRIRYTLNKTDNTYTSKLVQDTYIVVLDATNATFTVSNNKTFETVHRGTGNSLAALKRNARLALLSLGVIFPAEKRIRKTLTSEAA